MAQMTLVVHQEVRVRGKVVLKPCSRNTLSSQRSSMEALEVFRDVGPSVARRFAE